MEDSSKQGAKDNNESDSVRLVSFLHTEIHTTVTLFDQWIGSALEEVMRATWDMKPVEDSFYEQFAQSGQLHAEVILERRRLTGRRIFSNAHEVVTVRWRQLAPDRLKLDISPHLALGYPERRAGLLAYAVFLERLQAAYPEVGNIVDRAFSQVPKVSVDSNPPKAISQDSLVKKKEKKLTPTQRAIAKKIEELLQEGWMTDEDLAAHLTEAKLTLSSEKSITARQVKHIREKADIKKTAAKRV